MKNSSIVIAALALLASSCPNDDPVVEPSEGTVVEVVVHSPGLEGNLLGDSPDRNVTIYLPPGYELSDKKYPVVYLLHGFGGNGNPLWFGKGNLPVNLEPIMNQLIHDGTIEPLILVSPDSFNKFGGSWYINSESSGNWEDFIVQDVVQFVDNNYRTIQNSISRGITGHSAGGYGTVMIAMKHPEIYSAAYALSSWGLKFEFGSASAQDALRSVFEKIAACDDIEDFNTLSSDAKTTVSVAVAMAPNPSAPPFYCDLLFNSSGEIVDSVYQKYMAYDPYTSITTYENNLLQLNAIRLDCGDSDDNIYGNVNFKNRLAMIGVTNTYETYTGDHTNKLEERMKLKVIPFFSEILAHDD